MNAATPSTPSHPRFPTVAIVGVGLIGGSIAAALKQRQLCDSVIGVGRTAARLQAAQEAGLIDDCQTDIAVAAQAADLLIFCTPVDRIVDGVCEAAAHCRPGALITDAGSIKGAICRELESDLPEGVQFIGSHPLAGSEKNGFEHADAELFDGRICVVTPESQTNQDVVVAITEFWQSVGMKVLVASPEEHDRLLAMTSHVPHIVVPALAATLTTESQPFAASGFRDTTRIAASDPDLWTAILLANSESILAGLEAFSGQLQAFRDALASGNAGRLQNLLQTAKRNREAID